MTTPAILDTIDNAIADYELSADAMRWTPDPQPAMGGIVAGGPDIAAFAESMGYAVQAWQRDILNSRITVCIEAAVEPMRTAVTEAIKGLSLAFAPLLDELRQATPHRPVRVSQIRRAYRAKRRGW